MAKQPVGDGVGEIGDVEAFLGEVEEETPFARNLRREEAALAKTDREVAVFHALCAADKYDAVRRALRKGADVGAEDECGRTALHAAALHGAADIVSLLLKAEADPEAEDDVDGQSPLHYAAVGGNLQCAALLLAAGADVDAADKRGVTPIIAAIRCDREALALLLIQHTDYADQPDESGWTALHYAAWQGHGVATKALLRAGCDPYEAAKDCKATPLDLAVLYKRAGVKAELERFIAEHKESEVKAKLV